MKNYSSVFRMAVATITATVVYIGAPGSAVNAQNMLPPNDGATRPPAATLAQSPPALAYGVGEVVKMYQGGISREVILNYINNTALPYHLGADGIIYLQALGMPQEITKTMMQRDSQLQRQQQASQQYYQQQQPIYQQQPMPEAAPAAYGSVPPQQPVQVVVPTTPAPAVTVIGGPDYPVYDYGYPYYYNGYPYCGWPLYYGGAWGWGWGHGWGWGGWGRGGFRGGYGGFHGGGFGGFHGGGGYGGFHGGFGGGHGGGHR